MICVLKFLKRNSNRTHPTLISILNRIIALSVPEMFKILIDKPLHESNDKQIIDKVPLVEEFLNKKVNYRCTLNTGSVCLS